MKLFYDGRQRRLKFLQNFFILHVTTALPSILVTKQHIYYMLYSLFPHVIYGVPLNDEPWAHEPAHRMPPIRWANDEPRRVSQWEKHLFHEPAGYAARGHVLTCALAHCSVGCLFTLFGCLWLAGSLQRICVKYFCTNSVNLSRYGREIGTWFAIPKWYQSRWRDSTEASWAVSKYLIVFSCLVYFVRCTSTTCLQYNI